MLVLNGAAGVIVLIERDGPVVGVHVEVVGKWPLFDLRPDNCVRLEEVKVAKSLTQLPPETGMIVDMQVGV